MPVALVKVRMSWLPAHRFVPVMWASKGPTVAGGVPADAKVALMVWLAATLLKV